MAPHLTAWTLRVLQLWRQTLSSVRSTADWRSGLQVNDQRELTQDFSVLVNVGQRNFFLRSLLLIKIQFGAFSRTWSLRSVFSLSLACIVVFLWLVCSVCNSSYCSLSLDYVWIKNWEMVLGKCKVSFSKKKKISAHVMALLCLCAPWHRTCSVLFCVKWQQPLSCFIFTFRVNHFQTWRRNANFVCKSWSETSVKTPLGKGLRYAYWAGILDFT